MLLPVLASAQEFEAQFENPDENGTGIYNFDGKPTPALPSGVTFTHLATGGRGGTGGVQITLTHCSAGPTCNRSDNQGNASFRKDTLGGTYTTGVSKRYVRWSQRMLSDVEEYGSKFMIMAQNGPSNERVIFQHDAPFDTNSGCHPSGEGNDFYGGVILADPSEPPNIYLRATDFGFGSSWITQAGGTLNPTPYSTLVPHVNIGFNCAPFVLLPSTSVANIKPQETADITVNHWVDYQVEIISGTCGNAGFKVWANNDTYASPTTQALNMNTAGSEGTCAIVTDNWNGSIDIGGFVGLGPGASDIVYTLDRFEVSNSFDSSFHADGEGGGSNPNKVRLCFVLLDQGIQWAGIFGAFGVVVRARRRWSPA